MIAPRTTDRLEAGAASRRETWDLPRSKRVVSAEERLGTLGKRLTQFPGVLWIPASDLLTDDQRSEAYRREGWILVFQSLGSSPRKACETERLICEFGLSVQSIRRLFPRLQICADFLTEAEKARRLDALGDDPRTNTTPLQFGAFLREWRLRSARLLLVATDLSEDDVAFLVGYANASNFVQEFRKRFRMTPRAVRAQYDRALVGERTSAPA